MRSYTIKIWWTAKKIIWAALLNKGSHNMKNQNISSFDESFTKCGNTACGKELFLFYFFSIHIKLFAHNSINSGSVHIAFYMITAWIPNKLIKTFKKWLLANVSYANTKTWMIRSNYAPVICNHVPNGAGGIEGVFSLVFAKPWCKPSSAWTFFGESL